MWNLIALALWQKGGIPTAEERTGWLRTKNPYGLQIEHHTRRRAICTAKEPTKTE